MIESTQSDRRKKELLVKKMKPKMDKLLELMSNEKLTLEEAKVLLNLTKEHLDNCQYKINRQLLDTPLVNVIREDYRDVCEKVSDKNATDHRKKLAEDNFNRSLDRFLQSQSKIKL